MKGSILDTFMIPILIFVFFVSCVVAFIIISHFNASGLITIDYFPGAEVFDYGAAFLLIGLGSATVISAFFIKSHPIFFAISIVMFMVVLAISPVMSNVFMTFATNSEIVTYANQFPIMIHILANLPTITLVFGALIIVALYAAKNMTGGNV